MKYDIKKMEEVVYDISLRGLVKKPTSSTPAEKKDDDSMKVESATTTTGDVDMPNAKRVRGPAHPISLSPKQCPKKHQTNEANTYSCLYFFSFLSIVENSPERSNPCF